MSIWRMSMILTGTTIMHQIIPMTMRHTRRPAASVNIMSTITTTTIRITSILGMGMSAILPASNH